MSKNKDDIDLLPLDFPDDDDAKKDTAGKKSGDSSTGTKSKDEKSNEKKSDLPKEQPKKAVRKLYPKKSSGQKGNTSNVSSDSSRKAVPTAKKVKSKVLPIQGTSLPGQILQEGRVRANLSVEQVAQETKINPKYILSLEMGDAENLPPGIYVGAYIKQLCKLYKLDPEQVLKSMNVENGLLVSKKVPGEILHDIEKGKQINMQEEVRVRKLLKLLGVAVLLIILTVVVIVKMSSNKTETTDQVAAVPEDNYASSGEEVAQRPEKSISPEELEIFLAPQEFTMTELKVPK